MKVNVIPNVIPEISSLYQWIEVDFEPLKLCDKVNKVLNAIKDLEEYQQYVRPIMEVAATRMLRQVCIIIFARLDNELHNPHNALQCKRL